MHTFILDMDGVLYRDGEALPCAAEFVRFLRDRGCRVIFLTNNSWRTRREYAERLNRIGIPASEDDVITSAYITAEYLTGRHGASTAYAVGGRGIQEELTARDWKVIGAEGWRDAEFVIVGLSPEACYDDLKYAALAIRNGAVFIATNDDATYPGAEGILPGAGAIVAFLERATGRRAMVMGKPHDPAWEVIEPIVEGEVWVVGDRVDTDMEFGFRHGGRTVLLLTGVTREVGDVRPDFVFHDLCEAIKELEVMI